MHATTTISNGLTARVFDAVDLRKAGVELIDLTAVGLAGHKGVFFVGIGEITIRLDCAGMISEIVAGAALDARRDPAATILSRAVCMTGACGEAAVAGVGRILIAIITDLIARLVWIAVRTPNAITAPSD